MRYSFLLLSLIASLWVFFDSQKRGFTIARGLLWAVGVFFLLIVFLPLYLVARKKKEKEVRAAKPERSPDHFCFYCRKAYAGQPGVCPHCGQNLRIS